jgi:heme exporter protein C
MLKTSDRLTTILNWLAVVLMLGGLAMVFLYAPRERTMGDVQRIFYFHLGCAWVGFFAFFVTMASGILYLWKGEERWDVVGNASAEVGTVFMTMAIVSGSLWARPVWNTWWTWDPRLTATAVLWAIYGAYLILRNGLEEPHRRARASAVLGIIALVDLPMVAMATRWFRGIHPPSPQMEPAMRVTLLVSVIAFTGLFGLLVCCRRRQLQIQEMLLRLEQDGNT